MFRHLCFGATLLVAASSALGQKFDEKFDHWPIQLRIRGTVIAANELTWDADLAGGLFRVRRPAKAIVLYSGEGTEKYKKPFEAAVKDIENVEFESHQLKNDVGKEIIAKLKDAAIAVVFTSEESDLEPLGDSLKAIVAGGGMILVEGPQATRLGTRTLAGKKGVGLVTDSIIELVNGDDSDNELRSQLVLDPRKVGLRLTKDTAMVFSGRLIRVLGSGTVTAMVTANDREPFLVKRLEKRKAIRQNAQQYMIDLTQWRRIAMDRTLSVFPPLKPQVPHVEKGTLVIVGGGGMPRGLMSRLVDLAGGPEKAKMVYVPCSERDELPERQRTVEGWKRMKVGSATFIHTKDRNKANSDEQFLEPLKDATGLWFGGGRQWNFADSYYGTKAHRLMKDVLARGGVIGGSSAGASIQGRYLARATPINNFDIMAPGYERGGLGFLSGVAIDQHFSQRGRQKDMTQLVNKYPQLLGIGLDEATAIIVQKSVAEVVGRGKAHFYDRRKPVYPDRPDFIALPAGSKYDLAKREVMVDTREPKKSEKDDTADAKSKEDPAKK